MSSEKFMHELISTAKIIATSGKGILAADESTGTIGKRFDNISLENTEENRCKYRTLLAKTPNLAKHISGVILYEETLFQKAYNEEKSIVEYFKDAGIIPGIKVDKGIVNIEEHEEETSTQGIDGLKDRCIKYYQAGARFSKWRAVLKISDKNNLPSDVAIHDNAFNLARQAIISQHSGLVPIIEPEVLQDGDHSIEVCEKKCTRVFAEVIKQMHNQGVLFEGALLKPNLISPGSDAKSVDAITIGEATIRVLMRTIPPSLPSIHFLSGGFSEEKATDQLNAVSIAAKKQNAPWYTSFSQGRALQSSCIKIWKGNDNNVDDAQKKLLLRAHMNGLATLGEYPGEEQGISLFEKSYIY